MATQVTTASVRIFGAPCWAIGYGQIAVWPGDEITILSRVGKRYLCRVVYGAEGFKIVFYAWLPKNWLHRNDKFPRLSEARA